MPNGPLVEINDEFTRINVKKLQYKIGSRRSELAMAQTE